MRVSLSVVVVVVVVEWGYEKNGSRRAIEGWGEASVPPTCLPPLPVLEIFLLAGPTSK